MFESVMLKDTWVEENNYKEFNFHGNLMTLEVLQVFCLAHIFVTKLKSSPKLWSNWIKLYYNKWKLEIRLDYEEQD